ncbi:UDP-3-O-(3-hydroxymyristoyl)glucosamine N-acyltransferase [Candidatus Omnitrophota bacterium]
MKISKMRAPCDDAVITSDFEFDSIGMSSSPIPNTLTFAVNSKYLQEAVRNKNITSIITTEALAKKVKDRSVLVSSDPMKTFYSIYSEWVDVNVKNGRVPSISKKASIHPSAVIADRDVGIDDGVTIEENVVIRSNVYIGKNSTIRSNSVIGKDGFEIKKIDGINTTVKHNGFVRIGENVEINSGCCIDKGIFSEGTVIGSHTKIDNLCYVAHNANIGENCQIVGNTTICGSCRIGNNVWIGPSSSISNGITIGDNAKVTIGSTVVKDIPANTVVTGYFAQEHSLFKERYLKTFPADGNRADFLYRG